jgi:hypothetical protein
MAAQKLEIHPAVVGKPSPPNADLRALRAALGRERQGRGLPLFGYQPRPSRREDSLARRFRARRE